MLWNQVINIWLAPIVSLNCNSVIISVRSFQKQINLVDTNKIPFLFASYYNMSFDRNYKFEALVRNVFHG